LAAVGAVRQCGAAGDYRARTLPPAHWLQRAGDPMRRIQANHFKEISMQAQHILVAACAATALLIGSGCTVVREQQSVGSYIDDAALTTQVKAKFAEDPAVSAMAIGVETLKGVVQLSGFAKTAEEKVKAERLARSVQGVVSVRNDIVVRS
jgi:hyperosmotically inducible periplasmic protein